LNLLSENVFLSIDLRYQINILLKDHDIRTSLIRKIQSRCNGPQNDYICDIHDGKLYEKINVDSTIYLTMNGSTDGAPLGNKTRRNIWPLSFILNDLPPEKRFKHILLAGIMIVKTEPTYELINLYLKTFVEQLNNLRDSGINVDITFDGPNISLKPTVLCFSANSVARPLLQSRLKFNGYFGCSYCYQRGTYISTMRYPFENIRAKFRTYESHMRDIEEYYRNNSLVRSRGVKGNSVLCSIPNFDMVWGFPFDNMHTTLLGVTKFMWELWGQISLIGLNIIKKKI